MKEVLQFARAAMSKYIVHGFWILLPQAVGILLNLSVLPIVLAHLPVAGYGTLQFVISIQMLSTVVSAGQITLSSKRGIANGLDGTFLHAFFYRLPFLVFMACIGLVASLWFGPLLTIMSLYLLVGFLPQVSFPEYYIAKRLFKAYAGWQIFLSVAANVASAIAAVTTGNILIFAAVQFGTYTVVSLAALFTILFRAGVWRAYREKRIDRACVPYGVRLIPADIAVGSAGQVANLLIGTVFGFAAVAVFSVATRLDGAVRNVIGSLYNLLYGEFAQKGGVWSRDLFQKRLGHGFALSLFVSLVFAGLGFLYITRFMPLEYRHAANYFFILATSFPVAILQVILHTILETDLRYKEITLVTIAPNVLKILLIFAGGYFFGVLGVCIAIAAATWISFFFYYFYTLKRMFSYVS